MSLVFLCGYLESIWYHGAASRDEKISSCDDESFDDQIPILLDQIYFFMKLFYSKTELEVNDYYFPPNN